MTQPRPNRVSCYDWGCCHVEATRGIKLGQSLKDHFQSERAVHKLMAVIAEPISVEMLQHVANIMQIVDKLIVKAFAGRSGPEVRSTGKTKEAAN